MKKIISMILAWTFSISVLSNFIDYNEAEAATEFSTSVAVSAETDTTSEIIIPEEMQKQTGVSWNIKTANGQETIGWQYGGDKIAILQKDGKPVETMDFVLKFDYADIYSGNDKALAVVFGFGEDNCSSRKEMLSENGYNGIVGISTWGGTKKYKIFSSNEKNTNQNGQGDAPFFKTDGTTDTTLFDMGNGKTYNMVVSYIDKKVTMYVKEALESTWHKYEKTLDITDNKNGYIGILDNIAASSVTTELYLSGIKNASAPSGLVDINATSIPVTFGAAVSTVPENVTIKNAAGEEISCTVTKDETNENAIIITIPENSLVYSTKYTVDLSGVKDASGISGTSVKFTTMENPVPSNMQEQTELSWEIYREGTSTADSWDYGGDKRAFLNKSGKRVKTTDFILSFDYTDNNSGNDKALAVVFGFGEDNCSSRREMLSENGYNGIVGISTWGGTKKYKIFSSNEKNTNQNGQGDAPFFKTDGTTDTTLFDMGKGKTYNMIISYIDKKVTMYVKEASESTWHTYEKTLDLTDNKNGYIAIIDNISASSVKTRLYVPEDTMDNTVCFEDDFSEALKNWKTEKSTIRVVDGVMENAFNEDDTIICNAQLDIPYENMPENPVVNVRYSLGSGAGWMSLMLKSESDNVAGILLRNSGVWDFTSGAEMEFNFSTSELNVMYDMKFICKSDKVSVYKKRYDETSYTYLGALNRASEASPGLYISSYKKNFKIHKVEVCRNDITDFGIEECPLIVDENQTAIPQIINTTGKKVTLTADDSGVFSVDENGGVKGITKGNGMLTASTVDGSRSFTVPVVCRRKAESLTLSHRSITLTEGEVINLTAQLSPSGADDSTIIWESSDDTIASLFGNSISGKTLKAENSGHCVIKAVTVFGEVYDTCPVTVIPKTKKKGTSSVIFGNTGEKTEIAPMLFGMHRSPQKTNASENKLYSDLHVKSLRSFLNIGSVSVSDNLNASVTNNIPQVVMLGDFPSKTVSELLEIVKQVKAEATANENLYIEMGNEVYDGTMAISDYIAKCKEFYTAVKAYDDSIKLGIVAAAQSLAADGWSNWNNKLAEDTSYYDAVIVHNYTDFTNSDNMTREDMTDSMYAYNRYIEKSLYDMSEQFGGKEFWITEYGHLQLDMFENIQNNRNEIDRLQFGKCVGAALTNVEKLLDMAESGKVTISNYHFDNDAQGFGLIQDGVNLPNYYAFKKMGELLDEYNNMYGIESIKNDTKNSGYRIKSNVSATSTMLPSADCWGFGDDTALKKVVIANRTDEPMRFSLSGYQLSKEWSYGGADAFDGWLLWDKAYGALPDSISLPEELDGEAYSDIVELAPYSMAVCKVAVGDNLTAAFSIADGENEVRTDRELILTLSKAASVEKEDIVLLKDDVVVGFEISTISDNKYKLVPSGGWQNECVYSVKYGETTNTTFTIKPYSLEEDFTENGSLLEAYDNYEVSFKALRAGAAIKVRNVSVYIYNGVVFYNNGTEKSNNSLGVNSRPLGHYDGNATDTEFKITACGSELNVYAGKNGVFTPVGTIYNAKRVASRPGYSVLQLYSVEIKISNKPIRNIEFYVNKNNEDFYSNVSVEAESELRISTDGSEGQLIYAVYDSNGVLKSAEILTGTDGEYKTMDSEDGCLSRLYTWFDVYMMKSLQNSIVIRRTE